MKKLDFRVVRLSILAGRPWDSVSMGSLHQFLTKGSSQFRFTPLNCFSSLCVEAVWLCLSVKFLIRENEILLCSQVILATASHEGRRLGPGLLDTYVLGRKFKVMNPACPFFKSCIEAWLICRVVLITAVQRSNSVIHVYTLLSVFFSVMVYHRILAVVACAIQ